VGRSHVGLNHVPGRRDRHCGGNWPWAVAVVLTPAMWLMHDVDDELGTGLATLAAGLLLAGASVLLTVVRRRTQYGKSTETSAGVTRPDSLPDHSVTP